jgi:hypothetical protein
VTVIDPLKRRIVRGAISSHRPGVALQHGIPSAAPANSMARVPAMPMAPPSLDCPPGARTAGSIRRYRGECGLYRSRNPRIMIAEIELRNDSRRRNRFAFGRLRSASLAKAPIGIYLWRIPLNSHRPSSRTTPRANASRSWSPVPRRWTAISPVLAYPARFRRFGGIEI